MNNFDNETIQTQREYTTYSEMITLYQNIDSLLPGASSKVIQFMGVRGDEGTSTIVREFAMVAAGKLGKTVLIMHTDKHRSCQNEINGITPEFGWEDIVNDKLPVDEAVYFSGNANLFICPVSPRYSASPQSFYSSNIINLWSSFKDRFNLILIDSPSADCSDGFAFSNKVDGVILVLEAEKTRWPVAENAKNNILRNGGKILGMVFNKRHHYIPEYIYRRL